MRHFTSILVLIVLLTGCTNSDKKQNFQESIENVDTIKTEISTPDTLQALQDSIPYAQTDSCNY